MRFYMVVFKQTEDALIHLEITVVCFAHLTCKMLLYHIGGLQVAFRWLRFACFAFPIRM